MSALPPGPRLPRAAQTAAWIARPGPFMLRAQRRYGDVFTIRIGTEPPWVMLAHPDAVREVFTGDPAVMHAGKANLILRPLVGHASVLLLDGPQHLRQRKLMLPPFHGSRMAGYRDMVAAIAREHIARWPRGTPLPLAPRMQAITLDVVLRVIFGVDADSARLDALRERLRRDARARARRRRRCSPWRPPARDRRRARRRLRAAGSRPVDALLHEQIAERRAAPGDDVLSLLLAARHEDGSPMTDQELRDELITLLVAGHETTATALSWTIERLTRTPGGWDALRAGRRGVRRGRREGGAPAAAGPAGRRCATCSRPPTIAGRRPARRDGRRAVDLPRPPPRRRLPGPVARSGPSASSGPTRRAGPTRGSRSAAASAAASAPRSR